MKSKLLLYLFVFTAVILVFQLVNSAKVVNYQAELLTEKNENSNVKSALEEAKSAMKTMFIFLRQNAEAQVIFLPIQQKNYSKGGR